MPTRNGSGMRASSSGRGTTPTCTTASSSSAGRWCPRPAASPRRPASTSLFSTTTVASVSTTCSAIPTRRRDETEPRVTNGDSPREPTALEPTGVGPLLRRWRESRRLTQLELALDAEVSTRHLSFVESGRATPSREMLLKLAGVLDVPLRERNLLLLAAGYAP